MGTEKIKYLTRTETEMLFNEIAHDNSRHSLRNRAIFMVMKYCALRASEVGLLLEEEYDKVKYSLHCHRLKNSRDNIIRICEQDIVQALEEYLYIKNDIYPSSNLLFPSQMGKPISRQSLDTLMKYYCRNTTISADKQHIHVLKHTRAVELADMGMDVKDIQWWLGHKNISNTLIYMQYTTTQQEMLYQKYIAALQTHHLR